MIIDDSYEYNYMSYVDDELAQEFSDIIEEEIEDSDFERIFHSARFILDIVFDGSAIIIACQLPNGYVVSESRVILNDIEDDITACLRRVLAKACDYGDCSYMMVDTLLEELNENDDENPDCAHCEYFHECCGDMDVVDIDYYNNF